MIIREATHEDLNQLWTLKARFRAEARALQPEVKDRGVFKDLYRVMGWLLDPNEARILVAEFEGGLVGYVQLVSANYIGDNPNGICSEGLYVLPEHRGSKVALMLWKAAEAKVRSLAPVAFQISVSENNAPMHRLAVRRGFKPIAVIYQQEVEQDEQRIERREELQETERARL